MMIKLNRNKGITLISMILTVIVLLIIVGTISYSSRSSFDSKKLEDLYSDIDSLTDAISVYYMKNKNLPVYYSDKTITGENVEYQPIGFSKEEDTKYTFYIIDITKLNNVVLNNKNNVPDGIDSGSYCEDRPEQEGEEESTESLSDFDKALKAGMFVINSSTHTVYYTKGVIVDGVTYYTKNETFSKIPNFNKINKNSVEDDILDIDKNPAGYKDDEITVIFYANGGTDAPGNLNLSRKSEDMLLDKLNTETGGVPNKNGMKFLGWSNVSESQTPLYMYNDSNMYSCTGEDITLSQYSSNVIELYAVWSVNENNILYYYYPDESGGGVRPIMTGNYILDRMGLGDSVKNSLCIDVPTSGYTISWEWDESEDEEEKNLQVAQYYGGSQVSTIQSKTSNDRMLYQTTEQGRLEIQGSFSNLQIKLSNVHIDDIGNTVIEPDGSEVTLKEKEDENIKVVSFYQIKNSKDTCGEKIKNQWLTGNNGKMAVPTTLKSYAGFGLVDPTEINKTSLKEYEYVFDENSMYYLKSAIFTNENSIDISNSRPIDYKNLQNKLGSMVPITDTNNCMYLCFGARNYVITRLSGGEKIYHESLQEAYDQCRYEYYDKITLVRNVNDFGVLRDSTDAQDIIAKDDLRTMYEVVTPNYYVDTHDPTYAQECVLTGMNYNSAVILDCNGYILSRKASIHVDYLLSLNIVSASNGKIDFYNNTDQKSIKLTEATKLYINDNVEITSDNGPVVDLVDDSSVFVYKGIIKNTSDNNQKAITSNSTKTYIYLGMADSNVANINDNNYVSDDNVIISTKKGVVIDSAGNLIWKSGILKTADYSNKQGYNDGLEGKIVARKKVEKNQNQKPCLYFDFAEEMVSIKLGVRDWSFKDKDYSTGIEKVYYTDYLPNAHDCINLTEKNISNADDVLKITWINPVNDSGDKNDVTITKPSIHIDFKSYNKNFYSFNTSKLNINAKDSNAENSIILEGLRCETQKGFTFNNSNVIIKKSIIGNSKTVTPAVVTIKTTDTELTIGNDTNKSKIYTQSNAYAIQKTRGTLNINSNTEMYTHSDYTVIYNNVGDVNILDSNLYSANIGLGYVTKYVIENAVEQSNLKIENSKIESKTKAATIYNKGNCDILGTSQILSNTDGSIQDASSQRLYAIMNYNKLNILDDVYMNANYCVYSGSGGKLKVIGQVKTVAKNMAYNINGADSPSTMLIDGKYLENDEWVSPVVEVASNTGRAFYLNKGATLTMGDSETMNNFRVVKQLCPIIKTAGVGVHLQTNTSVFNFNNGVIYGLDKGDAVATITSKQYNAIYNRAGVGKINIPDKFFMDREINKTLEIQGTEYTGLQKIFIAVDCSFIDNKGNTYDDLIELFNKAAQDPEITDVIINKTGINISNSNFVPTQNRGDIPLTIDFNGKTMNVLNNGIINSGTLIIKDSTLRDSENPSFDSTYNENVFVIKNEWNGTLILAENGKILGVNRRSIINAGKMIVEDNFEIENNYKSQNPNEYGYAVSLEGNGTVIVRGNAKLSSLDYCIDAANNSEITITDNAYISGGIAAISAKNGNVIVQTSDVSTVGPKIVATSDSGIGIEASRLTLGTKDANVNVAYPMIQSKNIGVKVTNAFNFYDGSVWAPTPRNITGTTNLETGYRIRNRQQSVDIQGESVNVTREYLGR